MTEIASRPLELSEWVYKYIRDNIIDGTYQQGSQLNIEELTNELGVSRTPVREALLRLRNDRFVRSVPRVGFFVEEITREDFHELLELRTLVECYAAECAARIINEKDAARLLELQKDSAAYVRKEVYGDFLLLDDEIHDLLVRHIHNSRITDVLKNAQKMTRRIQMINARDPENTRESYFEHERIINAVVRHNTEAAYDAMKQHLAGVEKRLIEWISH